MKKYILILIVFATSLQSCDKFKDTNTNPNSPTDVNPDLLLNNVLYAITGDEATIGNGTYDMFVGGDMGGCWAQHWSKTQYNNEERFIPRGALIRGFWNTMYFRVLINADNMYKLSVTRDNKNLQGIAMVLKAYGFAMLTDCYGDIPFSEALQAEADVLKPKYDKQEDVYTGILKLLDDASGLLGAGGDVPSASDFMYNGDVTKWKKFANSLKFRCLMRIVDKKPSVASQLQALAAANGMFSSNSDEAKYSYVIATPNPIYNTIIGSNRIEYRVGKPMVDKLSALNDPRLAVYASKAPATNTYVGKPAGYLDPSTAGYNNTNTSGLGAFYLEKTLPAYLMSYAQLQLLMAEARQKGYISTSTTQAYYEEGIKASLTFNGVSSSVATYLAEPLVAFNAINPLPQIQLQEWLALFGQGVEAWTEWRRTKVPALSLPVDAATTAIPSRYTYPDNEPSINKANYDAVVASQGPDLLTTKVWWITL